MIFVDSDVFVTLFYPRDQKKEVAQNFLDALPTKATSIYNLLEICGILSMAQSPGRVMEYYDNFDRAYSIRILYPQMNWSSIVEFHENLINQALTRIERKMRLGDALVLYVAELHRVTHIVTFNKRDFEGRTSIPVLTPNEFMAES